MSAATPDYYEGNILPALSNALQNCWSVLNNASFKFLARKRSRQIKKCEDYGRPFVTIFNNSFIKPFNCNSTVQFNPNSTLPFNHSRICSTIQPLIPLFNPNSTIWSQFNYSTPMQYLIPIQSFNPAFNHSILHSAIQLADWVTWHKRWTSWSLKSKLSYKARWQQMHSNLS